MNQNFYDKSYYLNGQETKKSNYQNYSWLPQLTRSFANHLCYFLNIRKGDSVLDFGCARGYLVRALREKNIDAFGYDFSQWAIENCDELVRQYVSIDKDFILSRTYDFIIAKDVFEHIEKQELQNLVRQLIDVVNDTLFVIVPLTISPGGSYFCPKDEEDTSHVLRWTLDDWMTFFECFQQRGLIVSATRYVPMIKPSSESYRTAYGFFSLKKYYLYHE